MNALIILEKRTKILDIEGIIESRKIALRRKVTWLWKNFMIVMLKRINFSLVHRLIGNLIICWWNACCCICKCIWWWWCWAACCSCWCCASTTACIACCWFLCWVLWKAGWTLGGPMQVLTKLDRWGPIDDLLLLPT